MQFEVKIDETVTEPKVLILTDKITNEVNDLVRKLAENERQIIAGFRGDTVTLLDEKELLRVYASGGRVYAVGGAGGAGPGRPGRGRYP